MNKFSPVCRKLAFITLGNLLFVSVQAQQIYPGNFFELKAVAGTHAIGSTSKKLKDRLYGLDLSYNKNILNNEDNWAKFSKVQSYGFALVVRDLNNLKGHRDTAAKSFGQAYGLVGQIDFLIFKRGNTSFNFRPGVGLSYLSKTFFTDPKNRFIGSHINEVIKADLLFQTQLRPGIDLIAGLGFLHYSNGGFNIPNNGLNTLSISSGLRLMKSARAKKVYKSNFTQLQKNTFEINLGIGRRGVIESHEGLLKSGLYAGYNFYINDILMLKSGLDAVYYYTPFIPTQEKGVQTFQYYGTSYDRWRTGLSLGAETTLWRFSVNAQFGRYIYYNSYYPDINWYWTNSLIYNIDQHIGFQAKTYMHKSQADYINFGFALKF